MPTNAKTLKEGTNENTSAKDEENPSLETLEITMDKRYDLMLALFFASLGVLELIGARGIREGTLPDPITSRGLPNVTAILLIIGGIVLALKQLLTWSLLPGHLVPEEGQADEKKYPASALRATGIVLLSLLWGCLIAPLGFLIVTPLSLFAASWVMGEREWFKIITFSIIFTFANWIIFGPILGVRIPLGPLEDLALSFGLIM